MSTNVNNKGHNTVVVYYGCLGIDHKYIYADYHDFPYQFLYDEVHLGP